MLKEDVKQIVDNNTIIVHHYQGSKIDCKVRFLKSNHNFVRLFPVDFWDGVRYQSFTLSVDEFCKKINDNINVIKE